MTTNPCDNQPRSPLNIARMIHIDLLLAYVFQPNTLQEYDQFNTNEMFIRYIPVKWRCMISSRSANHIPFLSLVTFPRILMLKRIGCIIIHFEMSHAGGRPKDAVWEHFLLVRHNNKSFAKCKRYSREQSIKACRMKEHYKKCNTAVSYNPYTVLN